jgi:hypothetical protein
MPLRDHFHDPIESFCPWHSFHGNWATKMVDRLNEARLPENYTSQADRHFGVPVEIDVATLERDDPGVPLAARNGSNGGVATAPEVYAPPAPVLATAVAFVEPQLFEVKVYRGRGGWHLVAAVELVSESNKDREESRSTFAIKCASYLQRGVSVVVVDAVTSRAAELHNDLCDLLDLPDRVRWVSPTGLSATAYRVVKDGSDVRLDVWPFPLAVGDALPTVPLWLAADLAVPLELELTYEAACKSLRIR